ncbi:MAG: glycoside hydrolase family 2 [Candidatus Hydrogenedentes bacterium]|nr:glycoside hydrolase family 2 [Candidatus Hydrogenedentota bacterium]
MFSIGLDRIRFGVRSVRLVAAMLVAVTAGSSSSAEERDWPENIETEHWPGTYWWGPGSAWRESDIDFNLSTMAEAGIRNVHIVPIYGANGYEDRYIPYLSPEWMGMLDYVVEKARALDMNVDMTTGTGWCFGGPGLEGNMADTIIAPNENGEGYTLKPGRQVKRAAPGGEGMMMNPYSPAAMERYLERFTAAFDAAKPAMPRAQYHDSFEYQGNWAEEIIPAFRERRGYDLEARLPELFGPDTDADTLSRLKYDYRLTLAELHGETIQVWIDWSRARGMLTRDQAHGSPTNLIDLYAACDIPETEMFGAPEYPIPGFRLDPDMSREGDTDLRVCMLAASAAHVAHEPGKQLVSSETCTWLREHWHTNLGQVKLQLDRFFLAGINHIFYHGTCFSPEDAPWPGWFFYASTKFDWRNSIWRDLPQINTYVARCQSVLQAGTPANDILLYWPIHDLWSSPEGLDMRMSVHGAKWMSESTMGELAQRLMDRGYTFDFISDALIQRLQVRDGKLQAPGGAYRAVVVPECTYMPPETLKQLVDFAEQGGTVLIEGSFPADVPGFARLEERRAELAKERDRAQHSVWAGQDALIVLDASGLRREPMADAGLQFVRRRVDGGYYYFIVNHTAEAFDGWLPLATSFESAVVFDPMTGATGALRVAEGEGGKSIYLQLEPGVSTVVRTYDAATDTAPWSYLQTAGDAIPVEGPWTLEFIDGGPALPPPATLDALASWTETPGGAATEFAGAGRYTVRVDVPSPTSADEWILDLGDVRESARVRVNGKDAGTLVSLPFRVQIGKYLQPGENTIEIEVTNLTANRIRALAQETDDWKVMRDINIVTVDYTEFKPQEWPLVESGLLGPVRLVPMETVAES